MRTALVFVVLLAGCLDDRDISSEDGVLPATRPDGWNRTPEFVPFDGSRTHSADQDLSARAPDGWRGGPPAACQAYQDGSHKRSDSCEVRLEAPKYYFAEGPRPAWYLFARWDGTGEDLIEQERDESRRTVVAFDADGRAIGHVPRAIAFAVE